MDSSRLGAQLRFLAAVDQMKNIARGTLLIDGSRFETDAEHSWHFALMALTLAEYAPFPELDLMRVLQMALVHDLVEIYAGDTYAYDAKSNRTKVAREKAAADRLFSILPEDQNLLFRTLWEEFDAMRTPEAKYATCIDRLQPLLNGYLTDGKMWLEHGVSKEQVLERMSPVREGAPELWNVVVDIVEQSAAKGLLR